jgi:hypothetical protein
MVKHAKKRVGFHNKRGGRRSSKWPDVNLTVVAEEVGISPSHLSNIMSGVCKPSWEVGLKLAEVWSRVVKRQVKAEDLEQEFKQ